MSKIVITGASGHFGKATIDFLVKKGVKASQITGLVRDKSKAKDLTAQGVSIKVGDYDNYDSLLDAFRGAEKVLLISGTDLANRSPQHKNVINAAKEAGVTHVLYTSFERKNESADSSMAFLGQAHIETDKALKSSGLNYTIFRNNLYLGVIPMFVGEQVLDSGIFFPAGEGKVAFADRDNLAEAAANVLLGAGHENKEYAMNNVENYTFQTIADELAELTGKDIAYVSPSSEAYSDTLTKTGIPEEFIRMLVSFAEAIKQGEFEVEKSDLELLLGRRPTDLKSYLAKAYASDK
ncbi:SDR family oxidoreductase [Algoriphagus sp. Y33]|uniref:SDR family oxidoreductase n=1 Tax=Algoriphagus sp. Y33 TaxID=2772483 RepID=UPI001782A9D8|nr:SDR family oxidoreductase [Algoriphagus sp. Y33]